MNCNPEDLLPDPAVRPGLCMLTGLKLESAERIATDLNGARSGQLVHYAGIVTLRQQPHTASRTVFISLENETGVVQVICRMSLRDVKDLTAGKLENLTPMLGR